jgi:serine/threonine-protein kinase
VTTRRVSERLLAIVVAFALLAQLEGIRLARAQVDKAAAEELFREGRRLMKEGKYAEACPKFEGSQALDPATGTLLNLADCYEKLGRTASAWAIFREVVELSRKEGNDKRMTLADQHVQALEPRLSRLTIQVAAASRVPGLVVSRDGKQVPDAAFGLAIPLDPGSHTLAASAPGYETWSSTVAITTDGTRATVDVPPLTKVPEPPPPPATVSPPPPPATTVPPTDAPPGEPAPATTLAPGPVAPLGTLEPVNPEPPPAEGPGPLSEAEKQHMRPSGDAPPNRRKEGAVFLIVAGAGGLVGAGVFAYLKSSKEDEALGYCSADECEPKGVELRDQAASMATGAKVSLAAGLLVLAGGIVLYVTAPKSTAAAASGAPAAEPRTSIAPVIGQGSFALALTGSF